MTICKNWNKFNTDQSEKSLSLTYKIMTLLYILSVYLLTILISFPTLKKELEARPDICNPFTPQFVAQVLSIIPVYNVYKTIQIRWARFRSKRGLAKAAKRLRKHFANHPDPIIREQIGGIADVMEGKNIIPPNN